MYFICLLCCAIGAIQEGAVFWLPVIFSRDLGLNAGSSLLLLMVIPFSKLLAFFLPAGCSAGTVKTPGAPCWRCWRWFQPSRCCWC